MKLILPFLLSLFVLSCASTPQKRIEKHPVTYSKLAPQDQELVQKGRIKTGMQKEAVFLALGKPGDVSYGAEEGQDYEQWNYYSIEPVVRHRFISSWGIGCDSVFPGGVNRWSYGPVTSFEPRHAASVRFEQGRVTGYQINGSH